MTQFHSNSEHDSRHSFASSVDSGKREQGSLFSIQQDIHTHGRTGRQTTRNRGKREKRELASSSSLTVCASLSSVESTRCTNRSKPAIREGAPSLYYCRLVLFHAPHTHTQTGRERAHAHGQFPNNAPMRPQRVFRLAKSAHQTAKARQ